MGIFTPKLRVRVLFKNGLSSNFIVTKAPKTLRSVFSRDIEGIGNLVTKCIRDGTAGYLSLKDDKVGDVIIRISDISAISMKYSRF